MRAILAFLILVMLSLLVFSTGTAMAESRSVEAVGIYGIKESQRSRVIPKDQAIARARWEAVSRVALELMGEQEVGFVDEPADGQGTSGDETQNAMIEAALGKDTLPYMRSYRILEDQGERPVLFEDAPGIKREYVVVVEVIVDVDRVSSALESAGLVARSSSGGGGESLTLELVGLTRFEGVERVMAALRGPVGARRVMALEFSPRRQLIAVSGPFDAQGLAQRLRRVSDPQLDLTPRASEIDFDRLTVEARYSPPVPAAGE